MSDVGYGKPPLHSRFQKGKSGKLFEEETKRLSLLEKDRKICRECAEILKRHFLGKKTASYSVDAKKKIINLSVAKITESSMSVSLKRKLLLDVDEIRKDAGLDEDEILMEIINDIAAVFISHAHPDHYGLLSLINKNIPIYMSKASAILLKKVVPLLGKENYGDLNIKEISDGEEVRIDDFIVRAYEVDHSAASAMAFEISVEDKRILYSGDIRFHGRRAWRSRKLTSNIASPDYLLLEGSTLGRENQEQLTEYDIEKRLTEFFAEPKLSLIVFSTQNIDRLVSVYKACVRQNKILVLDPYSCAILENLRDISAHLPQFNWNNIRVYFAGNSITCKLAENGDLYRYKTAKVTFDEIMSNPEKYVVKANFAITEKLFEKFGTDNMRLIYSLWSGYLDKPGFWHELRDKLVHVHTSGHAGIKDLQDFVKAVRPKHIIPIHTVCKNKYADLFEADVVALDDNEEMEL